MLNTKPSQKNFWTHPSIQTINKSGNPLDDMIDRTRSVVYNAIQNGWNGPPFDPFSLADFLKIPITPREDVLDAHTVPFKTNKYRIEFNPNRPSGRIRYSVAHEIAHTFFPDCFEQVRNRVAKNVMQNDEWQLEMLCNIGAAEILMPIGSFQQLQKEDVTIDHLMDLRKEYKVSSEALFLRAVKLTDKPCFVFCSSCNEKKPNSRYQINYTVPSKSILKTLRFGTVLPKGSLVEECTAIGYTSKGEESWPQLGKLHIECVGLPPYPDHIFPRVLGIATSLDHVETPVNKINYLKGDATDPRGDGNKIIALIINDKANSWGAGFARAVQEKWPFVLEEFKYWKTHFKHQFALDNVLNAKIESDLWASLMVSQHGYGKSRNPRIRYSALEKCLKKLAEKAIKEKASVHMPRIGCGEAGGSWDIVSEMIEDILCSCDINVTIYDLPNTRSKKAFCQKELFG